MSRIIEPERPRKARARARLAVSEPTSAALDQHMNVTPMTAEQETHLQAWRAMALEQMPYMASTVYMMRPVNAPGLGTFAVDPGARLYIDFEAVSAMGAKWCAEAVLHEASHLLQDHHIAAEECLVRPDQRQIWNAAADAAINDDLTEAGCTSFEEDGITPAKIGEPDNLSPHHYFAALLKQMPPAPQGGAGGQGAGSGSGSGAGDASNDPFKGCGSGSGGNAAPCELDENDDLGGQAPAATAAEKKLAVIATIAAIEQHVSAKGRGSVPGSMLSMLNGKLLPAKVPWQRTLAAYIRVGMRRRAGMYDTDHSRRHRRRHRQELRSASGTVRGRVVVPGTYTPDPVVAIVRDTSGSMGDKLLTATSEVLGISRQLGVKGDNLMLHDADVGIADSRGVRSEADVRKIAGLGGTDMAAAIVDLSDRKKDRPSVIVVLTDGETPWPDESHGVPVVAVIISRHLKPGAPGWPPEWIKSVHLDD